MFTSLVRLGRKKAKPIEPAVEPIVRRFPVPPATVDGAPELRSHDGASIAGAAAVACALDLPLVLGTDIEWNVLIVPGGKTRASRDRLGQTFHIDSSENCLDRLRTILDPEQAFVAQPWHTAAAQRTLDFAEAVDLALDVRAEGRTRGAIRPTVPAWTALADELIDDADPLKATTLSLLPHIAEAEAKLQDDHALPPAPLPISAIAWELVEAVHGIRHAVTAGFISALDATALAADALGHARMFYDSWPQFAAAWGLRALLPETTRAYEVLPPDRVIALLQAAFRTTGSPWLTLPLR